MDNLKIFQLLEEQRDLLFEQLRGTSISDLYKTEYKELKAGRIVVFDGEERQMLSDLKELSKDTSLDGAFHDKLAEYLNFDNDALIGYFENEFRRVFDEIAQSGKQDQIQAIFVAYDYYYHHPSSIVCYGLQECPVIEVPRYIRNEFDYSKQVLVLENGINFQPAWLSCEEFEDLNYLDINYQLENLFQLHSRTLLHKALGNLNAEGQLDFLPNRPFAFYINEHDCEVMMLYRLF